MSTNPESARPRPVGEVKSWDYTADVVVVGFGGGGTGAALEAARGGADTLVLDRAGGRGGATFMSGGYVYTGGGTALQKACGYQDTPEEMYKFLMAATGPNPNEGKVAMYSEEGVAYFDWLVAQGVPYVAKFYEPPTWQIPGTYGLCFSGGEDAYPWNEIAKPAPRGHVPHMPQGQDYSKGEAGPGSVILGHLMDRADEAGVKSLFDVRVERLVTESDGSVAGVVARRYGKELTVKARKGVVITAGGFGANEAMKARYAPAINNTHLIGTDGDDGRGIKMAQAIGAQTQLMDGYECSFGVDCELLVRSIVVNGFGQRFVTEDTYPGRVGQQILKNQGGKAWVLFDEDTIENLPPGEIRRLEPSHVAETLAELETLTGIPEGALQATVDYYNKYAAEGRDPLLRKQKQWIKPLVAPFGVIETGKPPSSMWATFTLGGLATQPTGEVLHVDGEPIPGLYAAGRTASGVPASGYLSGASVGDSIFFGRKAGISAAAAPSVH